MQYLYLVKSEEELKKLSEYSKSIIPQFNEYLAFLKENYRVYDLPRSIVLTDFDLASNAVSDIPLPAYTNDYRTVMAPDKKTWKALYLKQLDCYDNAEAAAAVQKYYDGLSERNVLQILGHEMVHHSDLFIDETYETNLWFEEGMAEYISRKYFLSEEEFEAEKQINLALSKLYEEKFGKPALSDFTLETYEKGIVHVFYLYWRSFLTIDAAVKKHGGDVLSVFKSYHDWYECGAKAPLEEHLISDR